MASIFHFRQRQLIHAALRNETSKRVFTAALDGAECIRALANKTPDPIERQRLRRKALAYIKLANQERW